MNRPINHKSSSKLNLLRLITTTASPSRGMPMDFHNQLRHKLIINDHCLPTVMFKCQQTLKTRSISARLSERGFIAHFCMIYARTRCTLKFLIDRGPTECCIKSRNVCFSASSSICRRRQREMLLKTIKTLFAPPLRAP